MTHAASSAPRLRRFQGEAALRPLIESWLRGDTTATTIHDSDLRQLVRVPTGHEFAGHVLVKRYRIPEHRGRQETLRRAIGYGPAGREWRSQRACHRKELAVARPLAHATLTNGEELFIRGYEAGEELRSWLSRAQGCDETRCQRRAFLEALGGEVARLHRAGWVHGDLHTGNILVSREGDPRFLDLQRARPSRRARARLLDLARLDASLANSGVSLPDRIRVRRAAVGGDGADRSRVRHRVQQIGTASVRLARRQARRRTRRTLVAHQRFAAASDRGWRGLRRSEIAPDALAAVLASHRKAIASSQPSVVKHDHRAQVTRATLGDQRVVVKQVVKAGHWRRIADTVRGSPARRAWLAGYGLAIRGVHAALPLAFLERRVLGVPVASIIVLEDLGDSPTAEHQLAQAPAEAANALAQLVIALHRAEIEHGDLQASHIHFVPTPAGVRPALIDLEGVRFERPATQRRRIQALAELNASIPDAALSAELRHLAFERYAAAIPFEGGRDGKRQALRSIVERSLMRSHRWRGQHCAGRVSCN